MNRKTLNRDFLQRILVAAEGARLSSPGLRDQVQTIICSAPALLALCCLSSVACSSSGSGLVHADANFGGSGGSQVQPDGFSGVIGSGGTPGDVPTGDTGAVDLSSSYIEAGTPTTDAAVQNPVAPDVALDQGSDSSACTTGQMECGGKCVDTLTNPSHCGDCQTDCTKLPGIDPAAVACVAGACNIGGACLPGKAHCPSDVATGCTTDLSQISHCGDCTTVCSEPTPACANVGGADGGVSHFGCISGCVAPKSTRCSISCVDTSTDIQNCGRCGNACVTPSNGSAACVSGSCVVSCNTGFHSCGQLCKSDLSTDSCGTSCSPCSPPPPNASATCDGQACGFTCNTGFHRCGTSCAANTDVATCGASCTPCPTTANSVSTCDGVACGFTCNTGYHACSGACASNASLATCGSSCSPCAAAPANASATCNGVSCDFSCTAGYTKCGTACVDITTNTGNCGGCGKTCYGTCVASKCSVPFYDGFEAGLGNWSVDSRFWQLSSNAESGSYSLLGTWGGDLSTGCNITKSALLGQDMNLSGVATATLQFQSTSAVGANDSLSVLISTNGGQTWSTLSSVGSTSAWQLVTISLSAYVGQPLVRIGFSFTNLCSDCCGVTWNIDEVRVTTS